MSNLDELLSYDPLDEAGKITGKSYKDDEETMLLGFSNLLHQSQKVENKLVELGDTYSNMSYAEAVDLVEKLGFTLFSTSKVQHETSEVIDEVRWYESQEGILLSVESYRGKKLNMMKIYFYVDFTDDKEAEKAFCKIPMSRSFDLELERETGRVVFSGMMDVRRGLKHHLEQLKPFLSRLVKNPQNDSWFYSDSLQDWPSEYKERFGIHPKETAAS